ncbi:MAG: hypothetical protein JW902_12275 [Syntrophaceae bacterium]|nr:hypothetical protein [Syntrophaceae bacterium]
MDNSKALVPSANREIIEASGVNGLLAKIRPQWKVKNLIKRVNRILPVDPSSACQRIFNATIHDLREKIVVAGLDIAAEAAKQHRLPKIDRSEDVENLSVSRTIELSYRMGLLSRPEWRRMLRVYDIRKDLEHEKLRGQVLLFALRREKIFFYNKGNNTSGRSAHSLRQ